MKFRDLFTQAVARDGADVWLERFGHDAMKRAVFAYVTQFGPQDGLPEDGMAFVAGHILAERDALHRAKIALSDPRARGVEREVLAQLANGLDIEDALRAANAPAPAFETANVVPFRPRRKT